MFKISFLEYHVHSFKWKNGIIFYRKTFDKLYSNLIIYLILLKKIVNSDTLDVDEYFYMG